MDSENTKQKFSLKSMMQINNCNLKPLIIKVNNNQL